jgi:hypothetical protein
MSLDWTDEPADGKTFQLPGEDPETNSPPPPNGAITHLPLAAQVMRLSSWAIAGRVVER